MAKERKLENNLNRKYMTVKEVAEMLSCSVRTVNSLRTNNGLPCVKLGRLVRFPIKGLQEWLENQSDSGMDCVREKK